MQVGNGRQGHEREGVMRHYYAIAERGNGRTWWLSFPGLTGVFSAADDAGQIVAQATDALDTAVDSGLALPRSIEDGAKPPADLSEFEQPTIVVVIPFEHATEAKAAA
jgi:predicted RNase H-like HicB family nuclease